MKREKDEVKRMDLAVQKDEMILLKEFGNWIYVVRHLNLVSFLRSGRKSVRSGIK